MYVMFPPIRCEAEALKLRKVITSKKNVFNKDLMLIILSRG
jgi:hypothetical protein